MELLVQYLMEMCLLQVKDKQPCINISSKRKFSTAYFNGCPYIFLIYYYITMYVCLPHFYDLSALVGCWSSVSIRRIIYKLLNLCPFDYTAVVVSGKVERS